MNKNNNTEVTYVDVKQYRLKPSQQLQLRLRFLVSNICNVHSIHLFRKQPLQSPACGMGHKNDALTKNENAFSHTLVHTRAQKRVATILPTSLMHTYTNPVDALKVAKPAIVLDDSPQRQRVGTALAARHVDVRELAIT